MSNAITTSAFFGMALTVATYVLGMMLQKKTKNVLCSPIIVSTALCVAVLVLCAIPVSDYMVGGDVIQMMIGPATAVIGLNIYNQRTVLKENFVPVVLGCTVGCVVNIVVVLGLAHLFGLDEAICAGLVAKSCSTPFAMGITEMLGGLLPVTIVSVIFTGVSGAVLAPLMIKLFHVSDSPMAQGIGIGSCSHAIGTGKAVELGEVQGAMSGVAIGITGLITLCIALFL